MPSIAVRRHPSRVPLAGLAALLLLAGVSFRTADAARAAAVAHDLPGSSWTVYHGSPAGTGADSSGVSFSSATHAWTSPALDGQLYGEPLETAGRVYAATENDTLYALAADTGAVLWATHVGPAVPSVDVTCGDISPTVGITGTPVIDSSRNEIFAVADELVDGAPAHYLVGLNIYTGDVELDQAVDPPGASTKAILQRTGLNLSDGNVVFGYGGNDGDCPTYRGWVASVPEPGGALNTYATVPTAGGEGAVWMGGAAPEVDAAQNIWAATGNGSSSLPYDNSDSVIELSPALALEQLFAPSGWSYDNAHDRDLGSTAPALLANGTALQVGKSQTGFLLNQGALGGNTGNGLASAPVCGSADADGGDAVSGTTVYVPCGGGLEAVGTSPPPSPALSVLWSASGPTGPPITAGGLVWSIGGSSLYGLNPANGATIQQLAVGAQANHFPTPSVGDGLLLAPNTDQVVAFSGSAGLPGPPAPPPPAPPNSSYWLAASDGGIFTFGNANFWGSAGNLVLNRPVVGMAAMPDKGGYWLVASDGGVFTYGDARFWGSTGNILLNKPVVGMARTPDGVGYWLVATDGGVFSFGTARFHGSTGNIVLNKPVVGMAATPDGGGYWLVASDGGIFAFGDANFYGSLGNKVLNKPVVGIAATPDGRGYWLVASDGGIFAFGDANYFGSEGAAVLNKPVVGMAATPDGDGYWFVASDGGVFTFGDANFGGSEGGQVLNRPVVGMASAS